MNKYHKDTFDRIPEEKREKILSVAVKEFANKGYNNANINTIAALAGVSVGSLYKYFNTKEDFFLTVVNIGVALLDSTLQSIVSSDEGFFSKVEQILRIIQEHSRKDSDIIKLYNEMTSEGNSELVKKLSLEMESISSKYYTGLVAQAQKDGIVKSKVEARFLAFCLDNIFLTLQFSYGTEYYKERMRVYLGDDIFEHDEELVQSVLDFLRKGLS
ncbi:MAG: TetR/AcrR family transcriptional regulator [Spirochaetales bacterium]|nr:TetR/AcrR family transcriptional regulator [Spirochaetales bacterium]